jgi:hypothetical protein
VRLSALILGICLVVSSAYGDNPGIIPFGNPVYSGNGCPKNSISSLKTEEAITVLFDSYGVESSGRVDANFCHLRIPVTIPNGWQAEITSIDYRGFVSLDRGAWATLVSWFRFGTRQFGGSPATVFKGEREEDFLRRDVAHHWPGFRPVCGGGKVDLTLFNALTAYAPRGKEAVAAIDSIDGSLSFTLKWGRCSKR